MTNPAFDAAVREYWSACGLPGDPPELGESQVDAFIDLLDLSKNTSKAFKLMEIPQNPYPHLCVGDLRAEWALRWAIQVAELEAFILPGKESTVYLIDTIADSKDEHRVYSMQEGIREDNAFSSIANALLWMAAQVRQAQGKISQEQLDTKYDEVGTNLEDEWEDGITSGMFVLEELLATPFSESWSAYSRGQWPLVEGSTGSAPRDREDGWQRRLSLWLLIRFLSDRRVDLPKDISVSDLDAVHRDFIGTLFDFEEAMSTGEIPNVIQQAQKSDDAELASLANTWVQEHDAWRTAASVPDPEGETDEDPASFQHTPFTRKLMTALSDILDTMIANEELELIADHKDALLIEMVTAASDAKSVKHMLKKLTNVLVDSDHVEEIYATDGQIQDRLKTNLE